MYRIILVVLLSIVATVPVSSSQALDMPRFEPAECAFDTDYDNIDCGYLIVPENRSQPNGATIRLHVAYIHSRGFDPAPDPVIFLEGGPGAEVLAFTDTVIEIFDDILGHRDLILIDQRGVGYSEPSLVCPEYGEQVLADLAIGQNLEKAFAGNLEGVLACLDRLETEGIHVEDYNTRENAADIADLRLALNLKTVNIYGVSYGSRLATIIARDYPEGIRSVILDSAYPPSVDFYFERIANFNQAFTNLFAACAEDYHCNRAYPDLATVYHEVVEQLNREPLVVESYSWLDFEAYDIVFSGDVFNWLLTSLLRSRRGAARIPSLIYEVYNGDYSAIESNLGAMLGTLDGVSYGMYYAVMCSEATPFSQYGVATLDSSISPQFVQFISYQTDFVFGLCRRWQPPVVDAELLADVDIDIPALVLAGEIDPTTPPHWGEMAADMFAPGRFLLFPATGHGVLSAGDCPLEIVDAFLEAPGVVPNTDCIAHMPQLRFAIN